MWERIRCGRAPDVRPKARLDESRLESGSVVRLCRSRGGPAEQTHRYAASASAWHLQAHASMRANPRLLHHGLPHPGRIGCDFVKILRIEGRTPTRQIQLGRQKNFGVDKVGVARPAGCTGRREKQGEARFRTRSREGGLGPVTRPSRDDRSASAGGSAPSALPKCDAGRRNG